MGNSTDEYSQNQPVSQNQTEINWRNAETETYPLENHNHIPTYKIISLKETKNSEYGLRKISVEKKREIVHTAEREVNQ